MTDGDDVLTGLRDAQKHLPCRLLYDERGAELFEQICALDEYYPSRTELALLAAHLPELGRLLGPRVRVIEPGSGAGVKTRMLLAVLDDPAGYVPIDISGAQLEANARALRAEFAGLDVQPIHGDFTAPLELPDTPAAARTLVFFPGSTLGNFEPAEARAFLVRLHALAGDHGALLLGTDSNQDASSLLRAYDDAAGVTAAFDLNVLAHVNRSYDATFALDEFAHRATWTAERTRVEMQLVSRREQDVRVAAETFRFTAGETIVTEHCYKHGPETLAAMLAVAGWRVAEVAIDARERIRLWLAFS
ncbi:MAG TPA: L-histidine N(alpha)-methyltransferase [Kofleriaceae bacterium]|nr:L-histidine N(alpha)-methyltransferase [Kofleriaceae bacterium]